MNKLPICAVIILAFTFQRCVVDLVAQDKNNPIASPARTITVTGKVVDEVGSAIPDAHVGVCARKNDGFKPLASSRSDKDGHYKLIVDQQNEKSFLFLIAARKPGFAWASSYARHDNTALLQVADVAMRRPKQIQLKIEDKNGQPISDVSLVQVTVHLDSSNQLTCDKSLAQTLQASLPKSDKDGLIEIDFLSSTRDCQFVVQHPSFATDTKVVDAPKQPVVFQLQEGRLIDLHVDGADPKEVPHTEVALRRDNNRMVTQLQLSNDGHSHFRLKDSEGASLTLKHPRLVVAPHSIHLYESHDVQCYEFALVKNGRVQGRVVDEQSDRGAHNVEIVVVDPKSNYVIASGSTNANGAYEITCPAIECEVAIARNANWKSSQRHTIEVVPDSDTKVPPISAKGKPAIIGRVVTSEGIAARAILTHPWKGDPVAANKDGSFAVSRANFTRPGEPLLAFDPESGQVGMSVISHNSNRPFTVKLSNPQSVTGSVVDAEGKPVRDATIDLGFTVRDGRRGGSYMRYATAKSDVEGHFQFDSLINGVNYFARVSSNSKAKRYPFRAGDKMQIGPLIYDSSVAIKSRSSSTRHKMKDAARHLIKP